MGCVCVDPEPGVAPGCVCVGQAPLGRCLRPCVCVGGGSAGGVRLRAFRNFAPPRASVYRRPVLITRTILFGTACARPRASASRGQPIVRECYELVSVLPNWSSACLRLRGAGEATVVPGVCVRTTEGRRLVVGAIQMHTSRGGRAGRGLVLAGRLRPA